jgi:hypothetical protein
VGSHGQPLFSTQLPGKLLIAAIADAGFCYEQPMFRLRTVSMGESLLCRPMVWRSVNVVTALLLIGQLIIAAAVIAALVGVDAVTDKPLYLRFFLICDEPLCVLRN